MPTKQVHLRQADHNRALLDVLLEEGASDWAVTLCFYTVVQLVESVRVRRGFGNSRNHFERLKFIDEHLISIRHDYRLLKTASETARYLNEIHVVASEWFTADNFEGCHATLKRIERILS